MRRKSIFVLAVILGLTLGAFPMLAQEHPEHPEHPEEARAVDLDALEAAIEAQIGDMAGEDGWIEVEDEVTGKTWTLKLDKVHRDRLSKIAPDTYFACVDFDAQSGEKVDVDFFMKGDSADALAMQELMIHKVNGKARYQWREEDGFWKRVDAE